MSFFKHVQLHKYDITDKGISQACYDEMKADGYDIVITEKAVSYTHLTLPTIYSV